MKEYYLILAKYFSIVFFILLFFINISYSTNSNDKYFYFTSELGAGHYIYAGFGYDFAKKFQFFKSYQYVKSAGVLFGLTYLPEDFVYVYESSFFVTGEILNNKIKFNSGNALDIDWRIKIGKIFVKSFKYNVDGNAFTMSADFLFKSFKYFFIDISLPFVKGEKGTEIAPCIGAGFEYKIF